MRLVLFILFGLLCTCARAQEERPPNFVIIFADDLGYGDLSSYGHPTIRTPNLDRMAREGQRWTSFYTAANICTPSRAALLTGRLPIRSGMISDKQGVLFPDSHEGLPAEEITMAELLQDAGYATAIVGKWHLGHRPAYLPTNHGFDYYFGIPYSNDMSKVSDRHWRDFWDVPRDSITPANFDVPLMRNTTEIERPADQHTITRRYTEESMQFIREHEDEPFFVYLAHNLPHVPLFASAEFTGRSERGIYGDVVEEIDHGIGRILDLLTERGLAENTVVVFTSDNGPWLSFGVDGGSAGPLYAGKGTTWEGGHRVPGIFWAPGRIEAGGMVSEMGSTLDLLPTFAGMAGVKVPDDRVIDGLDLAPTLLYGQPSPRDRMFFYRGTQVYAARLGAYKAHYATEGAFGQFGERVDHPTPLLYHLGIDPGESSDIADQFPGVVEEINAAVKAHREGVVPGRDRLVARGN